MPTPSWARCHVELMEGPGFLDDCFRSSLWVKFQSASSESFANVGDIAGDYASMTVAEGAAVNGCGWRRDISSLALGTSAYPVFRVRLRGRDTQPQYKVEVEYTDAASTSSGWVDAPTGFEAVWLQLTAGKTVKYVKLYARANQAFAQAIIDYDYACILETPPLVPAEVEELVADLVTTSAVSGLRLTLLRDPAYPSLLLWLPMDEAQGSKAYDRGPGMLHGSVSGAAWGSGKYGGALSFDGVDDYVQVPGSSLTPTAVTASAWVRFTGLQGGSGKYHFLVDFKYPAVAYLSGWESGDGKIKPRAYAKDSLGNVLYLWKDVDLNDGAWHMVTLTWGAGVGTLYLDGVNVHQGTWPGADLATDPGNVRVGLAVAGGYPTKGLIDEARIYGRALTAGEVRRLYEQGPLSGAQRAGPGSRVMAYLAAQSETLVSKLFSGRVIDRVLGGEPDNPAVQLVCEDLGELLLERTFTREYASATQISTIVDDVLDESPELYQDKDTTNRAITNKFHQEGAWGLLEKLAEAATFASGETGANFWCDPGGAARFRRYGAFACPLGVSDGSGGATANIQGIQVRESIKGSPRLANDVRVIVFEEEARPAGGDALTESAEGWSSPDPTDAGYPQSDAGDKVAGTASVHFNTTNPGTYYRMRVEFPDLDTAGFDSLRFQLKYGAGLSIDSFEVRIWRGGWLWATDYYEKTGIAPQGPAAWHEYAVDLGGMAKTGNPGTVIANVQFKAVDDVEVGTGGFLIDNLRFVRDEKAGAASDAPSQAAYGKRTLRLVDKTITDTGYAGYVAGNVLAHRKNPMVTARVTVPGRGQVGYRPPQTVTVTSLKDGLDGRSFQIVRAQHRYTPGGGYVCELDLAAARLSDGSYEPKVAPAITDVGLGLAELRRARSEAMLNSIRSVWV